MAQVDKCPLPDELMQALLGRLSAVSAAAIESHLDGCPSCMAAVDRMEVDSQIVDALKAQPALSSRVVSPDLERLMACLDALHPDAKDHAASLEAARQDFPILPRSDNPDELGCVAHFRVIEFLGAGGMGVVYRAKDTRIQRLVALKLMRPHLAQDPDARARFLREALAVASVRHDHVVIVHEVGEAETGGDCDPVPFMAMELLGGISLHARMREQSRMPLPVVVRLGRQTAEALAALHARGLVHRDVKPGNIWLEPTDATDATDEVGAGVGDPVESPPDSSFRVKLLDFGLAAASSDTAESGNLGTLAYMAPEQFRDDAVDARCDLFGLGCVLYELCTGEHPFPDRRFSTEHTAPLLVSDINPAVPRALADLIHRMLQEDAESRPESARRVVRELSLIEESLANAPVDASRNAAPSGFRRSHAWRAGAAVLAVLAIVLASTFLHRRPLSPDVVRTKPYEEDWCANVRTLPPKEQLRAVLLRFEELNPGYSSKKFSGWIEPEAVIRFVDSTDHIRDIRPLHALVDIKTVVLRGSDPTSGQLSDLSPLQSLRIRKLYLENNPKLHDLSPLKDMPLYILRISDTAVDSLADVANAPLVDLSMARTRIKDLSPLRSMTELRILDCTGSPIESLEPLAETPLEELKLEYLPTRDEAVLKKLVHLRKINDMPVEEFRRMHGEIE
jgi:eukaryotic-like serine/threonine-protein kinase